ncbi:hypothetical protein O3G_MSEX011890 [Manduca sexta]|uniref:Reverse transcriptase domain-containing protein n=1 Tax=Manduca sexta TaxID=7130 RepID=A0A921ZN29_MANSE|nr:hypothetical protein O3G_MSEX011890 [Manduca sexta]
MSLNSLSQLNSIKNHNNRVLDLVFSNFDGVSVIKSTNYLSKIDVHHPPLNIEVTTKEPSYAVSKQFATHNFRKADYSLVNNKLSVVDWYSELSSVGDVNIAVSKFYSILHSIIEATVPKTKPRNFKYPSWFTRNLICLIKERDKIRKKFKIYSNSRDKLELLLCNKRIDSLIRSCYSNHLSEVEQSIRSNPKKIWSYIKQLRGGSSIFPGKMYLDGRSAESGDEICNLFATHFSSVYTPTDISNITDLGDRFPQFSLGHIRINERSIGKILKSLDVSKGPGPDGIPPLFIKMTWKYLTMPLKIIFEKSIQSSTFPSMWKSANVVPIYKKQDKSNIRNYRPVSILSLFSKVFERIVCPVITNYFKNIISNYQHGFTTRKSTVSNLLTYTTDIIECMDAKTQVDSIYTDFSSAFDKVNHKLLLSKLKCYGIHGSLLHWLGSYLENRSQCVTALGYRSFSFTATSGVPQGSHLGPILFLVFINDIAHSIKYSNYSIFADDLKLYRHIRSQSDVTLLQSDLDSIQDWCINNKMILNAEKCAHLRLTRNRNIINSTYLINGIALNKTTAMRDLGVVVDSKLNFNLHMDQIIKTSWRLLGFLKRVGKDFKNPNTLIVLYNSLVRSNLEYASPIWNPTYNKHVIRVERVQRNFTRFLAFKDRTCPYRAEYPVRLSHFKIDSLEVRRKAADVITLYKLIHGDMISSELLSRLKFSVPRTLPRFPLSQTFSLPRSRTNLGKYAPLNRLAKSYNEMNPLGEIDIFTINSVCQFRRRCYEILNSNSDNIY